MNPTAEFMTISPEQAALWLKSNSGNRNLRGWWVTALAEMIKRGDWITSHQGVAFSSNGRLLDGQHRLSAVIAAGMPVKMLVVRGVPDDAFKVIDAGVKRSVSDLTGLEKRCSQVARLATDITFPGYSGKFSSQAILDVANSGIVEIHQRLMTECPTTIAFYSSAPMRLAAISLVMNGCAEKIVFSNYANLVYQRFDLLSQIAHSLIRQVHSNKLRSADSRRVLACGMKVLNEQRDSGVLLRITDADIEASVALVRTLIKQAMSCHEQTA